MKNWNVWLKFSVEIHLVVRVSYPNITLSRVGFPPFLLYNTIQYNKIYLSTVESSVYIYKFKHAKINKRIWSTGLQDCRVGVHLNYYNTCLQFSGTEQTIGAFLYFREGYSTVLLHCTESFASDN